MTPKQVMESTVIAPWANDSCQGEKTLVGKSLKKYSYQGKDLGGIFIMISEREVFMKVVIYKKIFLPNGSVQDQAGSQGVLR